MRLFVLILFSLAFFSSCKESTLSVEESKAILNTPKYYHEAMQQLTDVIVHDIFSPPVASRIYAYPNIAAYEILAQDKKEWKSLKGQLNGFNGISQAKNASKLSLECAAMVAFLEISKNLIFSEDKILDFKANWKQELDSLGVAPLVWQESEAYGLQVASEIMAWVNLDRYKETRSAPKFNITDKEGEWKPTPPAYMEGIEPHWREIRTMVLKNLDEFKPSPPPPFDVTQGSEFYKLTMEVKDAVTNATTEHKEIASFWDCNPYVMNQTGHMMFASKKITPGGHWMGIAAIASKKKDLDFTASSNAYAMTAIALFDAFISCWDEKYRSNLIRPETVINNHFEETWKPILQTPPFPEHTSGHSVISTAAATVLTQIFGDDFDYVDDVEVRYGLPKRSFTSFLQASDEAAISRLYGGIHYMPAINDGVAQGKKIGKYIIENVSTQ